jgi:hypothetical protein
MSELSPEESSRAYAIYEDRAKSFRGNPVSMYELDAPLPAKRAPMGDVWIVIVEDRHKDADALPFSTEEAAVRTAREQMQAIVAHPEHIQEVALTPDDREDGWVLCLEYAVEEDCVRVVKRTMDGRERR